jgi:hypothetical protein
LKGEQEESRQFGSWLDCLDPIAVDDDSIEEQPRQPIALLGTRRFPTSRYIRQQMSQTFQPRADWPWLPVEAAITPARGSRRRVWT